jgi:hypothetical protein
MLSLHCTVAYLKPGTAEKYLEMDNPLEGTEILIDEIVFSNQDGETTIIKLEGARGIEDGAFKSLHAAIAERLTAIKS